MVFNEIKLHPKLTSSFIYIYFQVLSPDSFLSYDIYVFKTIYFFLENIQ